MLCKSQPTFILSLSVLHITTCTFLAYPFCTSQPTFIVSLSVWEGYHYQSPFDPSLIFGKLCCKFFMMDMVAFKQGGIGQRESVNIS